MPGTRRLAPLLTLAAAVVALSGCGSNDIDGTIPPGDAGTLTAQLDTVRNSVEAGECDNAASQASDFRSMVDELPAEAGTDLKDALRNAGGNLEQLVTEQCQQTGASGRTGSQPPPGTTDTTTTTTTTTPPPEEEKPPPGNEDGTGDTGGGNAGGDTGGHDTGGGTGTGGGGTPGGEKRK